MTRRSPSEREVQEARAAIEQAAEQLELAARAFARAASTADELGMPDPSRVVGQFAYAHPTPDRTMYELMRAARYAGEQSQSLTSWAEALATK